MCALRLFALFQLPIIAFVLIEEVHLAKYDSMRLRSSIAMISIHNMYVRTHTASVDALSLTIAPFTITAGANCFSTTQRKNQNHCFSGPLIFIAHNSLIQSWFSSAFSALPFPLFLSQYSPPSPCLFIISSPSLRNVLPSISFLLQVFLVWMRPSSLIFYNIFAGLWI